MTSLHAEALGWSRGVRAAGRWPQRLEPLAIFVLLVTWFTFGCVSPACAVRFPSLRPHDDVWLFSTRHIHGVQPGAVPDVRAKRYDASHGWQSADVQQLLQAPTSDHVLVVYIHGNRVDQELAAEEGRMVYQSIMANLAEGTPVRLVIWSWPSDPIRGPLRDARRKAKRTELESYCLAWFLTEIPADQKLSLLCYSFGTRIATGAMHLVRGGRLAGRALPLVETPPPAARVVLMAAAIDNDWMRPGGHHEMAIFGVDHLLNLYNRRDRVLKHYNLLDRTSYAQALGFTGMRVRDLIPAVSRIEQYDVAHVVRNSHAAVDYLEAPQLQQRIREVLLWVPLQFPTGDDSGKTPRLVRFIGEPDA